MKIALIGYGKMGKAIANIVRENNHKHTNHMQIAQTFSLHEGPQLSIGKLKDIDVAIEFTTPLTAVENIKLCIDAGVPVVVGTTGWYAHLQEVIDYCKEHNGTVLYAANFSVGVNIFFRINSVLAELMVPHTQYQIAIEETHHLQKLDAPSGTAIKTAQLILAANKNKEGWKLAPTDDEQAIPITAHRIDQVPGTHTVTYSSAIDDIKLVHTAHSRQGFAEGAVLAASWLKGKHGIFTMNDVLGI